jgi:clan AA aspartic protease (TIGR02281 family)
MWRTLILFLLLVALSAAAIAAPLDADRIKAIDEAASAFQARAAEAHKTGQVPRQADPGVGALLDTVFNTDELSHGTPPYGDVDKLSDWLAHIVAVGRVYLTAGRAVHDLGLFGPELGRFFDASVAVMQAITDSTMAELDAHPGAKLSPVDHRKLTQLRAAIGGALSEMIDLFRAPGFSVGWAAQRMPGLIAAAPSMARFLTPDELARLRATTLQLEKQVRDKSLRGMLGNLAVALAEPLPPAAPATVSGGDEIALESDGRDYTVPVRINGAMTAKFIVDSGASVVVLPKDMVDELTKSGAIAETDRLGSEVYITADGKRHKGARLMLRPLDVGGHTVTNVMADIAPAKAHPLLGQSFLAKFKSWTLDNQRHVLIIAE